MASYYPGLTELPFTYDQYDVVKFGAAILLSGIGLASWLVYAASDGVRVRTVRGAGWVLLGFLAWSALSTAFSVHRPTAIFGTYGRFEGLIAFACYAAIAFLGVQVLDSPRRLRSLAAAFVASGSLVALYGLVRSQGLVTVPEETLLFESGRAFSTFGNPDMLGVFLLAPMVLALGLALSEPDVRLRGVFWVAFALSAATLVLTYTRAAWLAALAALVALAVAAWRFRPRLSRVDMGFLALVVAGLSLVVVRSATAETGVTNVVERFLSLFDVGSGSIASRLDIWRGALNLISDRPVAGFGPDTLFLVWSRYAPAETLRVLEGGLVDSAHSLPLQVGAGIGIVGLLLYGVLVVGALVRGVVSVARAPRDSEGVLLSAAFCVALGAMLLAALASVTTVGIGATIWLLAAACAAPSARRLPRIFRPHPAPAYGGAALLGAGALVLAWTVLSADHAMAKARIEAGSLRGIEWAERAVARNPWNEEYRLELGLQHQDRFLAHVEERDMARALDRFGKAESVFVALIDSSPYFEPGHYALADHYLLGARIIDSRYADKAIEAAERAALYAPGAPRTIGTMALALSAQGRGAEAETVLREGLERMPGNSYLEGLLGVVTGEAGDE